MAWIEPYTLLAAFAAVTENIGLVCTATTTYDEPYHDRPPLRLARRDERRPRRLEPRDLGQRGRGARISAATAMSPRSTATARAREFAEVVLGLWRSWDDDAFVEDKEAGLFFDPDEAPRPEPRR